MNTTFEAMIEKLHDDANTAMPAGQLAKFVALDAAVDAAICESKSRVLQSPLGWGKEGQALATRAHALCRQLAAIGVLLSERCAARGVAAADEEVLNQALVATLANFGAAVRWSCMIRGEPAPVPYRAINALYRRIEHFGLALRRTSVVRDGETRTLTAEAHYLRAILLPLLCGRSFDPQQLEVLDAWLWNWVGEYSISREPEGMQPPLSVNLDGGNGIDTRAFRNGGSSVRYIAIDAMAAQLREAVDRFHDGEVREMAATAGFPVEAYTGVLDHVEDLFDRLRSGAVRRNERTVYRNPPAVEIGIGLASALDPAEGATHTVHLLDESEGGVGLLVPASVWDGAREGELVTMRDKKRGVAHVGIVARKFCVADGRFAIGVEWLAYGPRRLYLTEIHPVSGEAVRRVAGLYIVESDESGRADTFLLDESAFLAGTPYRIEFDDGRFDIRLNRVVRRGRGWVSAGYDVVEMRKRAGLSLTVA